MCHVTLVCCCLVPHTCDDICHVPLTSVLCIPTLCTVSVSARRAAGAWCLRDEHNGTCVLAKRCDSLILDYKSHNFPPVEVSEFTAEECLTHYPPHRHLLDGFDNSTQLCYGDRDKTRDTCQGDSGGPLIFEEGEVRCTRTIFGVMSSGVESM
uniref:Peptidase S1 domain-containing protein n=1 Tax=Bombyx mori TaxID=7091 RepID=A0A8R2R1X9_BOMMO|nr:serine protease snake-like [Bombyx mori]